MRRRLSSRVLLVLLGLILAAPLAAQAELAQDGALFLLLPVGARAVGMGQAIVADQPGTEAVWWNPAAIARAERAEAAIHHSQTIIATGDAVSIAFPSLFGVIVASANVLNYGSQRITVDPEGSVGTILPRSFVFAGTYATPIGDRVNAGITYKIVQLRLDCSGNCTGIPTFVASTSALDLGAQYDLAALAPISLGAAIRNIGLRLQVNDGEQADPLPTRLQVGAIYRLVSALDDTSGSVLRSAEFLPKGTAAHLSTDLLSELDLATASARMGLELVWDRRVHLRGGYVFDDSEGSGPSVGVGLVAGALVIDIARIFDGFSADAGEAPIHLSLRYLF